MKPFKQGNLDSLCGLYAVVNAISRAMETPLEKEKAEAILYSLACCVSIEEMFESGLHFSTMLRVLERAKCELKRAKLGSISWYALPLMGSISKLDAYLRKPQTSVILSLWGKYSHWSVPNLIEDEHIKFFDSGELESYPINNIEILETNKECQTARKTQLVICREESIVLSWRNIKISASR